MQAFKTEQQLFEIALTSPFIQNMVDSQVYTTYACIEPQGLFGIPDLVVANIEYGFQQTKIYRSFAFEMKLSNWKRALIQAYRYLSFANYSFVVLDRNSQNPAINHIHEFMLSNIGLISVDETGFFSLHYFPKFNKPYSLEMECKFGEIMLNEKGKRSSQYHDLLLWNRSIFH